MSRIRAMFFKLGLGISKAVIRFPLTVASLVAAAALIIYLIADDQYPASLLIQKWIFTLVVGAFVGMTVQFIAERSRKKSILLYGLGLLLIAGYFGILYPAPEISNEVIVRSLVAVFALFCLALYVPSVGKARDFNQIALIHFKSALTSGLYSGVMAAGLVAILVTIDLLLFSIDEKSYPYTMTIVWVVFAPVYYLSLLPKFNGAKEEEQAQVEGKSDYPKFLEILVSYIAIPLFSVYTLVLFAYFIKILVSLNWPSGQLGPMVLAYSAVGIFLFILSSLLENRFAYWYRLLFPKVLIPVVILQMIAVWIRLDAYGITESRYYMALFAIYSIATGVILSLKPRGSNGIVVLLSAAFAVFSILPPVDAFTVSRNSQIHQLEQYLQSEGILSDGVLSPKENVPKEVKIEVTNKLDYLSRSSSLDYIAWLPEEFELYRDFESTFGFDQTYDYAIPEETQYFYARVDTLQPLSISGYDIAWFVESDRYSIGNSESYEFNTGGSSYLFRVEHLSPRDVRVSVLDHAGQELVTTEFYDFALQLKEQTVSPKEVMSPEDMTLEVSKNEYRLKVVFQWIDMYGGGTADERVSYSAYVYFDAPQ